MPNIIRFDSNDPSPTIDGTEWKRNKLVNSPKTLRVHPLRTWHYYFAILIAIALLLSLVTGTGAMLYEKSRNIVQHYVDRMYGLDN